MNFNEWKYRYRRFRTITINDLSRRLEIRSWRRRTLDFVDKHSGPITSSSIEAWLHYSRSSSDIGGPDPDKINSDLVRVLPKGFLNDPNFWKTFRHLYPKETERLLSLADDVLKGRIELFGWKAVPVSVPSLEIRDADTADILKTWETTRYWDINFFHSKIHPDFDVKWLWELQRLQFLLWLGAAWRLTGLHKFAFLAREILDSWLSRLKYPLGVEWSSNLEVGLRLLSISRCNIMCMDSPAWDPKFLATLFAWNHLHATHLRKEITLHHTLGNHQLGEASSLMWFALIYPGFNESNSWKAFGLSTINRIIPDLIFADGVYTEQSTGYLKFAVEFMLPLIFLGGSKASRFSMTTLQRIISSLEFVQALSDCGKATPMIGDCDSGSAIGWRLMEYWDFSWLLSAGSTLFERPGLAKGIENYPAEAFLNTGLEGLEKFKAFDSSRMKPFSAPGHKTSNYADFPAGGYHVSNDSYFQMIFDSGPLGISPGYGHGHADALSILINFENRPIIVDTGTMHYNAALESRSYFRETRSHNTLVVNNAGQVKILDTFKWASGYHVQWVDAIAMDDFRLFSGELFTDSYVHQRIVLHVIEKGFIIYDRIWTQGLALVDGYFHFHPSIEIRVSSSNRFIVSRDKDLLELIVVQPSSIFSYVAKGSINPMVGWYSESYGKMVPSKTLKFSHHILNVDESVTVIQRPGASLNYAEKLKHVKSSFAFGGFS
ncbi:MAG: heparinase II/III family protein [Deltaproteobacteria bacterium]|nr:heparinase II/III family protein [Deltaproteobacteria bacterium]